MTSSPTITYRLGGSTIDLRYVVQRGAVHNEVYWAQRLPGALADQQHALAIYQQAVVLKQMPMNNATQLTDQERDTLRRWFEAGTATRHE